MSTLREYIESDDDDRYLDELRAIASSYERGTLMTTPAAILRTSRATTPIDATAELTARVISIVVAAAAARHAATSVTSVAGEITALTRLYCRKIETGTMLRPLTIA